MSTLSQASIDEFEQLTASFCKKSLLHYIDEHHPDGNFTLLPSLIDEACAIGIIAKANASAPGYDYGVWGKQTIDSKDAIQSSLIMLTTLAKTCASFAFLVHIQGIASHILIRNTIKNDYHYPLLILYDGFFPPYYSSLRNPSRIPINYTIENNYLIHTGTGYGYKPQYAIMCIPEATGWHCIYFNNTETILFQPLKTLGIRGLTYCARFNSRITHTVSVDIKTIESLFAYFWLGLAAIATGIAQSAYQKAIEYAGERYQRGSLIKNIESVQMLLGNAKASIEASKRALFTFELGDSSLILNHAAQTKLTATTLCSQAVTDCLQVFGGYGYMEDFGIEKKFRDCITLQTIGGSPFFMKQFIAQMEMEE
ncbi:MAG: acyl-CoA dehydrogenase family protein [Spirochaetota bacterium]